MSEIPSTKLSNGVRMPQILIGTFQVKGATAMEQLAKQSIALGGWGFDTSPSYKTEGMLGDSVEKCLRSFNDLEREDLFVQTKIDAWQMIDGKGDVRPFVEDGMETLKVDYLDALLIHWPYPDYLAETWRCFERLYEEGYVRAIGVCNVKRRHLDLLERSGNILPHIVQNEINPLNADAGTVDFALSQGIAVQSYSPLARMHPDVAQSPALADIARKHNRSIVQTVLRWHVERGLAPVVKTDKAYRIAENLDVFSFSLDEEDMAGIAEMNRDLKMFLESRCCPGW